MVPELTAGPTADLGVETRECVPALLGFDHVPVLPTGAGGHDARVNVVDHVSCAEAAGVGVSDVAPCQDQAHAALGSGPRIKPSCLPYWCRRRCPAVRRLPRMKRNRMESRVLSLWSERFDRPGPPRWGSRDHC